MGYGTPLSVTLLKLYIARVGGRLAWSGHVSPDLVGKRAVGAASASARQSPNRGHGRLSTRSSLMLLSSQGRRGKTSFVPPSRISKNRLSNNCVNMPGDLSATCLVRVGVTVVTTPARDPPVFYASWETRGTWRSEWRVVESQGGVNPRAHPSSAFRLPPKLTLKPRCCYCTALIRPCRVATPRPAHAPPSPALLKPRPCRYPRPLRAPLAPVHTHTPCHRSQTDTQFLLRLPTPPCSACRLSARPSLSRLVFACLCSLACLPGDVRPGVHALPEHHPQRSQAGEPAPDLQGRLPRGEDNRLRAGEGAGGGGRLRSIFPGHQGES